MKTVLAVAVWFLECVGGANAEAFLLCIVLMIAGFGMATSMASMASTG